MARKEGSSSAQNSEINEKLLQNLIELQKVHANLAEKFDSLSKQISQLLNLFENTARTFASNPINQVSEKDKAFLEKVDKLLEQNKTIAKGLTLMEERIRERAHQPVQNTTPQLTEDSVQPSLNTKPLPRF
ncbi:MAG TPA: hypothetical protein VHA12_01980 [Candidatus Nanoarchaeia archaeon]|nr:hypothetical protein [Candidatus Nanoarchaeia archaeon]